MVYSFGAPVGHVAQSNWHYQQRIGLETDKAERRLRSTAITFSASVSFCGEMEKKNGARQMLQPLVCLVYVIVF
ncbi:hypothetical protein L596_002617 [Steinernema carpocapsae]|uniref:Uncharacterized protein n=1 Tax=Steinernema carpocapsae TaxID=34508 RepID=A0A4U8UQ97_STECR|nr:hypothetical protein L596_002617 [Steinernema carpocapsae]